MPPRALRAGRASKSAKLRCAGAASVPAPCPPAPEFTAAPRRVPHCIAAPRTRARRV